MDYLQAYLPNSPSGGKLPYWLLFISAVSIFNSVQTYQSSELSLTRKVYEEEANSRHSTPQVTRLSARTFGTWTFISSLVRFYGAYYVTNPQIFQLTQWTFLVAAGHFFSEWLVFGTCKLGKGLAGPGIVSILSLIWMHSQKEFYLGA
ncbi:Erg28-like protein [Suhomyces tanzawaensis NRRL Y-17324]|uniref:Erg28-like protein n=1 Tax=Suhomyces tanzawaensis NRRL Y-17324 TaxID=984487 RepID=A0A1E4SJT6_9ASCO|nr:Erg28-like protein [Suhomyces tanzawaensis NRRL Y-17324]ODV79697.1 Erg28-like protein [Suhomyces tanzawaensis NRRL Y-17324]